MRKQRLIIFTVVSTVLLMAIIGIFVLLDNQTKATECNHYCDAWEDYISVHSGRCKYCGIPMAEPHTYKNGKCIKCGAKQSDNCKHNTYFQGTDEIYHWKKCSGCGVIFDKAAHIYNKGICTRCNYKCKHPSYINGICLDCGESVTHTHPSWYLAWDEYYHWDKCTECGEPVHGKIRHTYVNGVCSKCSWACKHKTYVNGICAECGLAKEHTHPSWYLTWDETYHWDKCTECGEPVHGKIRHTYVNGVCSKCSWACKHKTYVNGICAECGLAKEHTHPSWYLTWDETYHWDKCTECGEPVHGKIKHTYVNGVCSKCSYICSHKTTEWKGNDNQHWKICTVCNIEVNNSRKAHSYENGVCKECSYKCKHSSTIWRRDETSHWQDCKICQVEVPNTRATHTIQKWEKLDKNTHTGTCTVCNKIIRENHQYDGNQKCKCGDVITPVECKHETKLWAANPTEHWLVCKDCGKEVAGTRTKHIFANGKCTVCNYECKHSNTTLKKDNTYHWNECDSCGAELNKEKHSYTNGKCSCGKVEEVQECKHTSKEWRYTVKEHWQVCKDCEVEISGTKAAHSFVNGKCSVCTYECKHTNTTLKVDNLYHWNECNDCGTQLNKKEHSYTNGKCECGKTSEAVEECTHKNREWKANETEHWQVCKDCGKEIDGTRAKHVNVNGKCKNCGLQEKSTSDTRIPNTGNKTIAVLFPITLAFAAFGAIKLKKYKND